MFELEKEFSFEASHQLVRHDGHCARLHGHSWRGRIVVRGDSLNPSGPKENMLVDYGELKEKLRPIVEQLDHQHLNDVLGTDMPTSEFLARWIYERLWPEVDGLVEVQIEETCTSRCRYRRI